MTILCYRHLLPWLCCLTCPDTIVCSEDLVLSSPLASCNAFVVSSLDSLSWTRQIIRYDHFISFSTVMTALYLGTKVFHDNLLSPSTIMTVLWLNKSVCHDHFMLSPPVAMAVLFLHSIDCHYHFMFSLLPWQFSVLTKSSVVIIILANFWECCGGGGGCHHTNVGLLWG